MTKSSRRTADTNAEGGASLVMVLALLALLTAIAVSLLFTSEVELKSSRSSVDQNLALADTDSAIQEVLWRLGLPPQNKLVPAGSLVTVNNLVNYDARIVTDTLGVLNNAKDDDGDGVVDEPDELNLTRDWELRILLTGSAPVSSSWVVTDTDAKKGPPWGSHVVAATIQPSPSWRSYSTSDVASDDVLTLRFARDDTDYALGDTEGDGAEIIFYDETLATNEVEDKNTLSALGGNGKPADDSPYNITWTSGGTKYPAKGSPVLILETTGRVQRGGRDVARRRVETRLLAAPCSPLAPVSSLTQCPPAKSAAVQSGAVPHRLLVWRELSQ